MKLFLCLQKTRKENSLNIADLIFIYCIGGLLGNLYETILFFFLEGEYVDSSASVIGPFNVVYGTGILFLALCLYKINNWLLIWLFGAIIAGLSEYTMSLFEEFVLRISSWNYSRLLMNFNGRTTFPLAIAWGFFGMIIIVAVLPFILKLLHKIPRKIYLIIGTGLIIYNLIDLTLSFVALLRYSQRMHGKTSDNDFLLWIDQIFNNDYMKRKFPNLGFK